MYKLKTNRRIAKLFALLSCLGIVAFTSITKYVTKAPLYVTSLMHDLTLIEVPFTCNYNLDRPADLVVDYTQKINTARKQILDRTDRLSLVKPDSGDLIVLHAKSTEYQNQVDALGYVITVIHTCSTPLCRVSELPRFKWGTSVGLCPENLNKVCEAEKAHAVGYSLERNEEHKPESGKVEVNSKKRPDFYLHIIPNGTISTDGFVQTGNALIVPHMCRSNTPLTGVVATNNEKEVFVITQVWGNGWYHGSIEDIPRLAPYVAFLRANPSIKIHIHHRSKARMAGYLKMLGLDVDRIVKGDTVAEMVYLPQGGGCGQLHEPSGNILTNLFQMCMANWKTEDRTSGSLLPPSPVDFQRNLVILIKRSINSNGRGLARFEFIEKEIKSIVSRFDLEFYVFSDVNMPSFSEMVTLFHRAVLIIGPHGAGLSNIVFSQPQTYIVEILCRSAVNICYADIASKLGMHYRGLFSKTANCKNMELDLGEIFFTVAYFLQDHKSKMLNVENM